MMTSHAAPPDDETDAATFLALPDDGVRRELLDGVVVVNPSPLTRHQRLVARLFLALEAAYGATGRGEVFFAPFDVVLDRKVVVQPDLLVVLRARQDIVTPANVRGAPDLVVEVLSDGTRRRDVRTKKALYERAGVRQLWLVDPEADRVEVYALVDGRYAPPRLHERPGVVDVDGVALDLDRLFA
jgi:Uma2 family endonuclease